MRRALFAVVLAGCSLLGLPSAHAAEVSINWSGYAVEAKPGEAITALTGSWFAPKVNHAPPGFSSSWIGIGGYRTSDVIQLGTASNGNISGNHAWYELLPATETAITSGCAGDPSCTVLQGDRMFGSITNTGGDRWQLSLTNFGKGSSPKWTWSKVVSYVSSRSSAELVFEAPSIATLHTLPANAPHAKFLGGATMVVNGASRPFAAAHPSRIHMNDPAVAVVRTATASLMAADGHFQVCAYKRTCPNF